jgi:hypothetical protein
MGRSGQLEPILVREEKRRKKGSLKKSTALVLVEGSIASRRPCRSAGRRSGRYCSMATKTPLGFASST